MADIVSTGSTDNDGTGDPLRAAFRQINARFQEILGTLSQITWAPGLAIEATPARQWTVVAGQAYVAAINHTAAALFATDLAAGRWLAVDVVQLEADLAGAGGAAKIGTAAGRTLQARLSDQIAVLDTVTGGVADDTVAIQAILNSGKKVIDFLSIPLRCDAVTVPAGVSALNVNFTKITPGGNLVLLNTGSQITGKLSGTGTVSTIERMVYPAANGVKNCYLFVEVSNATVGVHGQPLSGTAEADMPDGWTGTIHASNIVGTVGASEGYALLLSPAKNCNLKVIARNIRRHAVYLSAGAHDNRVAASVDGCGNYAAQLYSTAVQAATRKNRVTISAINLTQDVALQSGVLAISQNTHDNHVTVNHVGAGVERHSVLVEGVSAGVSPARNKIDGAISGSFTAGDVVSLINETETHTGGLTIDARSAAIGIAVRVSGTHPAPHAAIVERSNISFGGETAIGVYVDAIGVPCKVGENRISNNGTGLRVRDDSVGKRYGFSRVHRQRVTTASIGAGASVDTAVTLPFEIKSTTRVTDSSIYQAGSATGAAYSCQSFDTSDTVVTIRTFNGHASAQAFGLTLTVAGD